VENLGKGTFYGDASKRFHVNGLTIIHSTFHHYTSCPWHYHQNAHFAFTTRGNLIETHKKGGIQLAAGSLLYNHSIEPHCNSHYAERVAALHLDIEDSWFDRYDIDATLIAGVHELHDPGLKQTFYNIFRETQCFDGASPLAVETLLLECLLRMSGGAATLPSTAPAWVSRVRELLYDRYSEPVKLKEIAAEVNLHPVYLCQRFSFYFHSSFGEYLRKIRIEKAVQLLLSREPVSLTAIAFDCGFADQSHFIRTFKKQVGVTPLTFRQWCAR
jgi:AraC family transcriptional regulator